MGINANYFFVLVLFILLAIYVAFKPMKIDDALSTGQEVAEMELNKFTLYSLDETGLQNIMIGDKGFQYKDRLEVKDINYTDSSKRLLNSTQADNGIYDNINLITLEGNVRYHREDGVRFFADKALMHEKEEIIDVVGPFTLYRGQDKVVGLDLFYDTKNGISHARDVIGDYTLN